MNVVARSWREHINGRPMYVMWKKMQILQPILKNWSKPLSDVKLNIAKAMAELLQAQVDLGMDRMNTSKIDMVKKHTDDIMKWKEIEEMFLKQRTNLDLLKFRDVNNKYFHASIKARNNFKQCICYRRMMTLN